MYTKILIPFSLFSIILATSVFATEYQGKVISVTDGDTVKILVSGNRQMKIRLAQIDAPERNQAYGNKSTQSLSDLIYGKHVKVIQKEIGKYGRVVGQIYYNSLDINAEQVKKGMAWVYKKYATDKELYKLEEIAKSKKIGLWQDKNPVPPWEFRHSKKNTKKSYKKSSTSNNFSCGNKRYCKEMTSCSEAKFYLNECGLSRLDRDKDGIPCESICR